MAAGAIVSKIFSEADDQPGSARFASRAGSRKVLAEGDGGDGEALEAQSLLMPPDVAVLLPDRRPWMEDGPSTMALALGKEERRIVHAINTLLEDLENERQQTAKELKDSKVSSICCLR